TTRALLAANAHVGHSAHAQHSSMLKYVFGVRGGVSVLNLDHTLVALRRAAALARAIAASPSAANSATSSTNTILFVGTRPALHALVVDAALASGAAFLTKWVGGTLTNAPRVLRRSTASSYSKRPRVPSLVILLDLKNNMHAVRECNQLNIPIIAICDSDCDASAVQYPIPANDDSLSSVGFIAGILANAIREG
ncbi:ribosomal protein S2, flavodoxin-like domain-containing protein, partial [Chytriomyces sp. MP71]